MCAIITIYLQYMYNYSMQMILEAFILIYGNYRLLLFINWFTKLLNTKVTKYNGQFWSYQISRVGPIDLNFQENLLASNKNFSENLNPIGFNIERILPRKKTRYCGERDCETSFAQAKTNVTKSYLNS